MLRVIIDSKNIASDETINGVNIQKVSLSNIVNNINRLMSFKKYLQKCLLEGDSIIIITFIDLYFMNKEVNSKIENLKIINTTLTEKSTELIINEIIKYKDESLEYIDVKIKKLEEMLELIFISIIGY